MTDLPTYHGICPYCASAVSCVTRDGMTYARCSHRGCGARGPYHRDLIRAVEWFTGKLHPTKAPAQDGAERCEECADGCYPYYGGAPGSDYAGPTEHDMTFTRRDGLKVTVKAGTFAFARREPSPRETWPANFREDPECPGLGTWECPACNGTGKARR